VIKLIKIGQMEMVDRYKRRMIDQSLTVLRARQYTGIFTTPKLLEALCEKVSPKAPIKGVFAGHGMTPQFCKSRSGVSTGLLRADLRQYAHVIGGPQAAAQRDNYAIIYYPPSPRALIEVVDPMNLAASWTTAKRGASG
jgi:hypothetical protein